MAHKPKAAGMTDSDAERMAKILPDAEPYSSKLPILLASFRHCKRLVPSPISFPLLIQKTRLNPT